METKILFRGKQLNGEDWLFGEYYYGCIFPEDTEPQDCFLQEYGEELQPEYRYKVDENSVGIYTGFTDKNNSQIYTGDILKVYVLKNDGQYYEYVTEVRFEDGAFVIQGETSKGDYDTYLAAYINPTSPIVELEIIGNIYDNSELLTNKQR